MTKNITAHQPAGFLRRVAAIFYDGIMLFTILFITSIPIVVSYQHLTGRPLYGQPAYYLFVVWLYGLAFFYFGWFWTKTGQTPGMKIWKIRLKSKSGENITWVAALKRFVGAMISWMPLGLGFLWTLFSADKSSWHDKISASQLLRE